MPGNSFGKMFRITTFGESHGYGVGVIIDGCPPSISLGVDDFNDAMAARRPGRSPSDTPRREKDQVEVLSGIFEGLTTGMPIALLIHNRDVDSRPYEVLRKLFRPGHADYTYFRKYGHFDFRGGGRASARETAARVAAGVVADRLLRPLNMNVFGYTVELGGIQARDIDFEFVGRCPFSCPDPEASKKMEELVKEVRRQGDSLGGIVEVRVSGCPAGLGEPVFDKLEADLAKGMMSVGAVKGVEIGSGFGAARLKGSCNNDPITPDGFLSNHAGGILGGISNGDEIVLRAGIKPIPSISKEQDTVDREGRSSSLKLKGRYDISAIPRIIPVLKAMVKIVIADHYLRQRAILKR
jgi:chorismate synthase